MEALRNGTNTKFAEQRTKALKDAERDLTQAVRADGQEKNPAAWYYLGRYYLVVNDFAGADSALTKALALEPKCKDDISLYRRQAWVPVYNTAAAVWQAGDPDSAIVEFWRANQIYRDEPPGFIYLAHPFITRPQPHSALKRTNAAKYRTGSLVYANRLGAAGEKLPVGPPAG